MGGDNAIHFIAMELVDGSTLRERIRDTTTPRKDLLRWLAQTADALAKAHAAGIVHRDLKSENVMISKDGYAKVLDFGLAKLVETRVGQDNDSAAPTVAAAGMTAEGVVLGTVGYMSPEQVRAESVDHRSDIFSFGCLLYECVTRRLPFIGETPIDVMHRIMRDPPPAVRELAPDTPTVLRRMIRRCLEKERERRYQSMKDLSLELSDLVEDYDELARAQSPLEEKSDVSRRAIATGATLCVLLGVAVGLVFGWSRARSTSPGLAAPAGTTPLHFSQLTLNSGMEYDVDLSPDGSMVAYVKQNGSGKSDIYVQRVDGRRAIKLTESGVEDRHPSFSPDGKRIAFVSAADERGGIFTMGATGEARRRLTDFGFSPDWSPDGRHLVFATKPTDSLYFNLGDSALWLLDLETPESHELFMGDASQPKWSPGGQRIAYMAVTGGSRNVWTLPAVGGEPVQVTRRRCRRLEPCLVPRRPLSFLR